MIAAKRLASICLFVIASPAAAAVYEVGDDGSLARLDTSPSPPAGRLASGLKASGFKRSSAPSRVAGARAAFYRPIAQRSITASAPP